MAPRRRHSDAHASGVTPEARPKNGAASESEEPLLSLKITRTNDSCPFLNAQIAVSLAPGNVLWLRGPSGAGKSFTILHLAGLDRLPGASVDIRWDEAVPASERLGVLFQKGVLIDSLSLAENVALSLRATGLPHPPETVAASLEAVGLNLAADGAKMPGELSGGMLRRAALAQVLAQRKRVVVLDEPFVGLDPPVAAGVARLLASIASSRRIALIVVSHLEPLVEMLSPTHQVLLERARPEDLPCARPVSSRRQFARLPFAGRVWWRLFDYLLYSLPLIVCAFAATGAAVAMLLADMMERIDTVEVISSFLKESLAGNPVLPMVLGLVDQIVRANEAAAKQKLFALALGSIFAIELGPLLTALLLAGRIGGSYSGEVAMMAATSQLDLLALLTVSPTRWTLAPALLAALLAAPILTAAGTVAALATSAVVGNLFGIMSRREFATEARAPAACRASTSERSRHAPWHRCGT